MMMMRRRRRRRRGRRRRRRTTTTTTMMMMMVHLTFCSPVAMSKHHCDLFLQRKVSEYEKNAIKQCSVNLIYFSGLSDNNIRYFLCCDMKWNCQNTSSPKQNYIYLQVFSVRYTNIKLNYQHSGSSKQIILVYCSTNYAQVFLAL